MQIYRILVCSCTRLKVRITGSSEGEGIIFRWKRWKESVSILLVNLWQTLLCYEMINLTNRRLDKQLQEIMNFSSLEINLMPADTRPGKMTRDAWSHRGKHTKKMLGYVVEFRKQNVKARLRFWQKYFTWNYHMTLRSNSTVGYFTESRRVNCSPLTDARVEASQNKRSIVCCSRDNILSV